MSLFCFVNKFIYIIFKIRFKSDIIFVFLCITAHSMIISRSTHVAASGIISFFLMANNNKHNIVIKSIIHRLNK